MKHHWKELLPVDRYIVRSKEMLHEQDRKIMTLLYQPLIGSGAFSLYMTLWSELEQNRLWGEENTHHNIMLLQQANLKDIYQERLKLEGIGLLQTYIKEENENRLFIYELQSPLTPNKFFNDGMLNIYLYKRIGKSKFLKLKRFFSDQEVDLTSFQPITKSFSEVFMSIKPSEVLMGLSEEGISDLEVEGGQEFFDRTNNETISINDHTFNFELFFAGISDVMIPTKSITPNVKEAIKKLSFLYNIGPVEMQSIVMGSLDHNDNIDLEKLRKGARDWYQFETGNDLPALSTRVQPVAKRTVIQKPRTKEEELMYQLEITSPRQLLLDISGGAEPSQSDLQIIEEVMFKQKLLPGVVNVLIYYVMLRTDMKLTKAYVDKIASHWARKHITTVKDAMNLAKQEHKQYQNWATTKNEKRKGKPIRSEMLPDWLTSDDKKEKTVTSTNKEQEFEEERRKLEEEIKSYKKRT